MADRGHDEDRQAARDLLGVLLGEVLPQVRAGVGADGEHLVRLYALRDHARAATLGPAGAAVAGWIGRAAALVRDEADREQAVLFLRRAGGLLADAAGVEPNLLADRPPPSSIPEHHGQPPIDSSHASPRSSPVGRP